jgi:HEAT repeat protein
MLQQLVHALVQTRNEAADDVLLDALRLGNETEKTVAFEALVQRRTIHGLGGVIAQYDSLPQSLQLLVLNNIRAFHPALRECGRSDDAALRLAAMRLIALGRQGKLAYVLSDSLHSGNETLSRGAVEAMVALARWVATTTRRLQKGPTDRIAPATDAAGGPANGAGEDPRVRELQSLLDGRCPEPDEQTQIHAQLAEQRPEIEQAVARALDGHRGAGAPELLRAGLLLCDWPGSRTLAILRTAKHGGQSAMVRRLQQPPESEHVEAFLLGASHGGLRSQFGITFAHVEDPPVLDALLRKTHWLKDHQLQLCMHQVTRGCWWGEDTLGRDLLRRSPADAARIGDWLATSGSHDIVQDERLTRIAQHASADFAARLRLLRLAMRRPRGASIKLICSFLSDNDERLVRLAAREIVRRRPADYENILLPLMTSVAPSVRRVISRCVGQAGFEQFWQRFDRLDQATRRAAGRAMLKILPDAAGRLGRRLLSDPPAQQVKAIQMAQELGLVESFAPALQQLCADPNPKVRSKAVAALGEMNEVPLSPLLDRVLHDSDARVRANAIEVLETRQETEYVPVLAQRARAAHNRERANAIKAMHKMKVGTATAQLSAMLGDERPEHRISAMWTLRQIGWWRLLNDVARLAKEDPNLRVRRYALAVLRDVSELLQPQAQAV